jgi:hypothetical protein
MGSIKTPPTPRAKNRFAIHARAVSFTPSMPTRVLAEKTGSRQSL